MNKLLGTLGLVLGLMMPLLLQAQPNQEVLLNELAGYIKAGKLDDLAKHFDQNLQLNILDQKNFYSKSQSTIILKDFFASLSATDYTIQHKGGGDTNWFMVGLLQSSKGNYRLSVHLREQENERLISFLSIEKNKH